VVNNLKGVLRRGGYVYITAPSHGFPFHAYPYDFWRYEVEDLRKIFNDFEIIKLVRDHQALGVFLKARKPFDYSPSDLQGIALYSMIIDRRTTSIPSLREMPTSRKAKLGAAKAIKRACSLAYGVADRAFK
jgi:hypothetical protein